MELSYGVIGMELGIECIHDVWHVHYNFWWSFSNSFASVIFRCGASSLVTITSVGAVNSRHLLYGAVFSEYLSHLKINVETYFILCVN